MNKAFILLAGIMLAGCSSSTNQAPINDAPVVKIETPPPADVRWLLPSPAVIKYAQAQQKLVMLYFNTNDCEWCELMKTKTFQDTCVVKELHDNYVSVDVNVDNFPEMKNYLLKQQYPTVMFALPDAEGTVIPAAVPGYIEPAKFCELLKVVSKDFHDTDSK